MTYITNFTSLELEEELERRRQEKLDKEKAEELKKRKSKFELIIKHRETLLIFVPDHGNTDCSDYNPCYGFSSQWRCKRCDLLTVTVEHYKEYEFGSSLKFYRRPV